MTSQHLLSSRRILILSILIMHCAWPSSITGQQRTFERTRMPPLSIGAWIGDSLPHAPRPRYTIIDFWATWCTVCIGALPHIHDIAQRYRDRGIAVLCMAVRDREERVREAAVHTQSPAYVAVDRREETWSSFGLTSLPSVWLIDAEGFVRWRGHPSDLSDVFLEHLLRTDSIYTPPLQQRVLPLHFSISLTPPRDPNDRTTSFGRGAGMYLRKSSVPPAALVEIALSGMKISPYDISWVGDRPLLPVMDLTIEADSLVRKQAIYARALDYFCTVFSLVHRIRIERQPNYAITIADSSLLLGHQIDDDAQILPGRRNDGEDVILTAVSLDMLHHYLTEILSHRVSPFVTEAGADHTTKRYTFRLQRTTAAFVLRDLRQRYGIDLQLVDREVEIHSIDATAFRPPF